MHRVASPGTEQPPPRTHGTPCMPHSRTHPPSASHPRVPRLREVCEGSHGEVQSWQGRKGILLPSPSVPCPPHSGAQPFLHATSPSPDSSMLSLGHCHCHQRAGLSDALLLPVMICRAMGGYRAMGGCRVSMRTDRKKEWTQWMYCHERGNCSPPR